MTENVIIITYIVLPAVNNSHILFFTFTFLLFYSSQYLLLLYAVCKIIKCVIRLYHFKAL